jgi:hypothetical protein
MGYVGDETHPVRRHRFPSDVIRHAVDEFIDEGDVSAGEAIWTR